MNRYNQSADYDKVSVSTLPFKMHYVGANLGLNGVKIGMPLLDFDPPQ